MNIEKLYELKKKYEKEALIVEAKIEVVDDLIKSEIEEQTAKEIIEFGTEQADYSATDNVM